MPEDLKLSQIGSSQLPPPFRGLHSPGVRKHCQIIFACYFRKSSIVSRACPQWRSACIAVSPGLCRHPPVHVSPTRPRPTHLSTSLTHTAHLFTSQPPVQFPCKSYSSIHVPSPIHTPATSTCPHAVQGPPTRLRPTYKS